MSMITEKQTGLMPSWPRGRGIAETFGFLALITLLSQVGSFVTAHVFPDLDPGDPSVIDVVTGVVMAALFASVWHGLRTDRLGLARLGIALIGSAFLALICWVMIRNMRTGDSLGGFEGFLIYGIGSLFVFGCWLAFREVQAEAARREDGHA